MECALEEAAASAISFLILLWPPEELLYVPQMMNYRKFEECRLAGKSVWRQICIISPT
jgi:hypothetical protein